MIACYCRVSAYDQKPDSQRNALKRWLNGNGIPQQDVQWFEDTEAGTTTRRPAFAAMQCAVFAGEVKTVVVWKLDRISRNQKDGITLLADWCERGVRVVSVTQQIDLNGSVGRLIARALGVTPQTVWRYLKQEPKQPKVMRVELYLAVENNNSFVCGKTTSREDIEWDILRRYQMEKPDIDVHLPGQYTRLPTDDPELVTIEDLSYTGVRFRTRMRIEPASSASRTSPIPASLLSWNKKPTSQSAMRWVSGLSLMTSNNPKFAAW